MNCFVCRFLYKKCQEDGQQFQARNEIVRPLTKDMWESGKEYLEIRANYLLKFGDVVMPEWDNAFVQKYPIGCHLTCWNNLTIDKKIHTPGSSILGKSTPLPSKMKANYYSRHGSHMTGKKVKKQGGKTQIDSSIPKAYSSEVAQPSGKSADEVFLELSKIKDSKMASVKSEVIDPCEDSGFSSISTVSATNQAEIPLDIAKNSATRDSNESTCKAENNSATEDINENDLATLEKKSTIGTIGENIIFADPSLIKEEQLAKLARKKAASEYVLQKKLEREAEQEAYENQIKERQYKRLMHLLGQSKALTSFMTKKISVKSDKKNDKKVEKNDKDTSKKRSTRGKRKAVSDIDNNENNNADDDDVPLIKKGRITQKKNESPKTRGRKPKNELKLNLSNQEIEKELAEMSDEETVEEDSENQAPNTFKQPKYFQGELREYQKIGLNWLISLYENGVNGILGDEMGLGKTIQVIALFAYLLEKQIAGPYLIIVPLSTLPNWISEFERFAPSLPVHVIYGSKEAREVQKKEMVKKIKLSSTFSTLPIVLMTYEGPLSEHKFLRQFNWRYIVIDEAQRIKNFQTILFRHVKSFNSINRLLLTGTPLQNDLSELWSLLHFLLPDIFKDLQVFQAWFDAGTVQKEEGRKKFFQEEEKRHVLGTLREILNPFMLRRLKEDVCPDIPPFKEVMIYTPMTALQLDLYKAVINRDMSLLFRQEVKPLIVDVDGVRPKRRCTLFPKVNKDGFITEEQRDSLFKFVSSGEKIDQEKAEEWQKFTEVKQENVAYLVRINFGNDTMIYRHIVNHPYILHYPLNDCGIPMVDENVTKVSGKMLVLDAMLKKLKPRGHKILLFSAFKMVLDVIEDYLILSDYDYVRLDGDVKLDDRKNNIERFQTDPNVFVFLLTTKAGAVGLNLAAADTVIIYDSDWNPQNDIQAMARCHRIGQTKPVVVYRLCTKGSVDEHIIGRANTKRFLEKAVIAKEGNLVNTKEGLIALREHLDKNAFTVVDSKKQVYTDAELDELLDRSDMFEWEKKK